MGGFRAVLKTSGRVVNEMVSFVVFCILDLLDVFLCHAFKLLDLATEYEWRPCYCGPAKEAITSRGQIFVAERGQARVVSVSSTKLQLEELSDTLYTRPSLISEMAISVAEEFRRVMAEAEQPSASSSNPSPPAFTVSSTIVEMLQGKMGGQQAHPIPRWSDCDCTTCPGWISSSKDTLFVYKDGANGTKPRNLLLHTLTP